MSCAFKSSQVDESQMKMSASETQFGYTVGMVKRTVDG